MKKIAFLLLVTLFFAYAHEHNQNNAHECMHDEIDGYKLVPPDFLEKFNEVYGDRNLQKSNPLPIRITVDYKELDNPANGEGMTPAIKEYLRKIMEAAQIFLGKLIKVNRRTTPIKMLWGNDSCFDVKLSKDIQEIGQSDSDLHIYVTFSNKPEISSIANALHCQLDPNPVIGRVSFNIGKMSFDDKPQVFQDNFSTSLHEILHILGFSGYSINYWIDQETGQPYGENNQKIMRQVERWGSKIVNKIYSKNILRVARNHYSCPSIDGMYLENQGGGGSMGSHWERDLLGNEFMSPSIVRGTYAISEFTAALLLDTGYYSEVNSNMLTQIYWGKNRGCEFFNNSCNAGQEFPEFPDPKITDTCDFFSIAPVSNGKYDSFSQCSTATSYGLSCQNVDQFPMNERFRQNSGPGSRCFRSNATAKGDDKQEIKARCFKAKCAADNQSIDVSIWGTEKVNYTETKTSQGFMKCPGDFDQFCNFPITCPNQCSNNGVCNNGICMCLFGWAGEDCSKQCPVQFVWDGSRCVPRCPSGTFKNNDNVCKSTCPYKYYKDTNTNSCELCNVNCSICSGPASNQCTACNSGFILSGNTCVETKCHASCITCSGPSANQCNSCATGKYLDSNKSCQPCKTPCSTCTSETVCTSCVSGYSLNNFTGQCQSNNVCDDSCLTCSSWRNANSCTSCNDSFTLVNGQCIKCSKSCKKCSGSPDRCQECASGYTYDAQNQRCYLECDPSCQGCSQSKNPNACTSCPGFKYLKDGQCLQCDSNCYICQDSPKNCVACNYGFTLDAQKGVCNSICRAGEYLDNTEQRCKPCNSPCGTCQFYEYYCTSCISGYTLDASQKCQPSAQTCHSTCNTCKRFNDDRACDSCRNGMYLSNGQCLNCSKNCATCNSGNSCQNCLSGFQLQNGQCIEKTTTQCHSSCKTCSSPPNGNRTFCTSCSEGSFLQGEACQTCQSSCKTCSDQNQCTSCATGFVLNNGKCTQQSQPQPGPSKCDPSCGTCSRENDAMGCLSCKGNNWLQTNADKSLGRCLPCDPSCNGCQDTYRCTACSAGNVMDRNGSCFPKRNLQTNIEKISQTLNDSNFSITLVSLSYLVFFFLSYL